MPRKNKPAKRAGDDPSAAGGSLRAILRARELITRNHIITGLSQWIMLLVPAAGVAVYALTDWLIGAIAAAAALAVVLVVLALLTRTRRTAATLVLFIAVAAIVPLTLYGRKLGGHTTDVRTWLSLTDLVPLLAIPWAKLTSDGPDDVPIRSARYIRFTGRTTTEIVTIAGSMVIVALGAVPVGWTAWAWIPVIIALFVWSSLVRDGTMRRADAEPASIRAELNLPTHDPNADPTAVSQTALNMHPDNIKKGIAAEEATAQALAGLPPQWAVFHSRHLPGRNVDLDHLCVGPPGTLLLDSKNWTGVVSLDEEDQRWTIDGDAARMGKLVKPVAYEAYHASELLGGDEHYVVPVIVAHGLQLPAQWITAFWLFEWTRIDEYDNLQEWEVYHPVHIVAADYLQQFLLELPTRPPSILPSAYSKYGPNAAAEYAKDVATVIDYAFPRP